MVTGVAAGIVPALVDAFAKPFAALATTAASTPGELKKAAIDLALNDVVAPFLHAGSEKLGDAFAGALVHSAAKGTPEKPKKPRPPSEAAVKQVRTELQLKLEFTLAANPAVQEAAKKAGLTSDQLAAKLAQAIAQHLASDLAQSMARVPSSAHVNKALAASAVAKVAKKRLSHHQHGPPLPGRYTVKPGDSLWRISQRLLGPNATTGEISQAWRMLYRDNRVTVGANPGRIAPGQKLRIPRSLKAEISREWVLLPWLVVVPGILTRIAARRRRRSHRAASQPPATQVDSIRPHASPSVKDDGSWRR